MLRLILARHRVVFPVALSPQRNPAASSGSGSSERKCKRLYTRVKKFNFKRAVFHLCFLPD